MSEGLSPNVDGEEFVALNSPEINEEEKQTPIDALIVFGGGVLPDSSLEAMNMGKKLIGHPEKGWRMPLGAKMRALAAAELYLGGQVKDVILTGGATGKGLEFSEAQLMQKYFLRKLEQRWRSELKKQYQESGNLNDETLSQIEAIVKTRQKEAEQHVLLEDKATNTIENFAYTVNFIDKNPDKYQNIALLSNNFHIDRIVKLAGKMKVEGKGIGSEDIVSNLSQRHEKVAQRYFDPEVNEVYRNEVLVELGGDEKIITERRLGDLAKERPKSERRWSRGLDEIPEYWLPNIKFIENPERLKSILSVEEKVAEILAQQGIADIETANPQDIQTALGSIERLLPPKEWGEE